MPKTMSLRFSSKRRGTKIKHVQSNLVNSKFSGQKVLFRIIRSSNHREVKYITSNNDHCQYFCYILTCNYKLSKSIVHEIKFGDIAVM